ncbi:MAG: hypothetical protein M3022_15540 [Actinomycetota bacterium]|nr:hypothetical protein [Actinomycetota bacterium]
MITMVAISALSVPVIASAAARHRVRFTTTIVGAGVTATQSAYGAHDSVFGSGAGIQTVKLSSTGGSDSEVTYYGNASAKSKGTFKLGTPDANGIAAVTGSGRDISGTGKAKGLSSTYTYTGTYNTKTTVYRVKLTGTYTF